MSNTLAIEVGKDKVRFLVNGTEVTSVDAAKVDTAGTAGPAREPQSQPSRRRVLGQEPVAA